MAAMMEMLALIGTQVKTQTEPAQRSARRPPVKIDYPVPKARSAKQAPSDITNLSRGAGGINGRGRLVEAAGKCDTAEGLQVEGAGGKDVLRIKAQYRDVLKKSMGSSSRDTAASAPNTTTTMQQQQQKRAAAGVERGHHHGSASGSSDTARRAPDSAGRALSYKDAAAMSRSSSLPSINSSNHHPRRSSAGGGTAGEIGKEGRGGGGGGGLCTSSNKESQAQRALSLSKTPPTQHSAGVLLPSISSGPRSAPSGAGRPPRMLLRAKAPADAAAAAAGSAIGGGGGGGGDVGGGANQEGCEEGGEGKGVGGGVAGMFAGARMGLGGGSMRVLLRERNRGAAPVVDEEAEAEKKVTCLDLCVSLSCWAFSLVCLSLICFGVEGMRVCVIYIYRSEKGQVLVK